MKEQFSGVSADDAAAHLNNFCHIPKFWNVKINKIGTMYVVLIEISQGIKTFFIYLNPYLKTILNLPLFVEELILQNKITKYY
jgi:hypothetical protein